MSKESSETTKLHTPVIEAYGLLNDEERGIAMANGIHEPYDVNHFVTVKVFGKLNGTVFTSSVLWKETFLMAAMYWIIFGLFIYDRMDDFSSFVGKESSIRAFLSMFSTLIGLLLSFYTALNLGRWWQMRMAVDKIIAGSDRLTVMLCQITQDKEVLQHINRYARASLFIVFAQNQEEPGKADPRTQAVQQGLLTQEEVEKLELLSHKPFVQAETLWVWIANVVTRFHNQGLSKGAPHYCSLMAAVEESRSGIECIQTFLETPIPIGYVHLLCLMVKLHNVILTLLMSMATVKNAGGRGGFQAVGVFRTAFRAFFMPFLYNAILILNSEVTNPFGGDPGDFEFANYDVHMAVAGKACAGAIDNAPKWITKIPGWFDSEEPSSAPMSA